MRDYQLFSAIRSTVLEGFAAYGGAVFDGSDAFDTGAMTFDGGLDVDVKQAYQPTRQGANSLPTIYMHKINDHRHGHVGIKTRFVPRYAWDTSWTFDLSDSVYDTGAMVTTETQVYETTFQLSALVKQFPQQAIPSLTASDVLNACAMVLNGETGREKLRAAKIGVLRIMDIRNSYFENPEGQFEANPTMDFVVTHVQEFVKIAPVVSTDEFIIRRV